MYCSRCGAQLASGIVFCGACGAPAGQAAAVTGGQPSSQAVGPTVIRRPGLVTALAVLQFFGAGCLLLAALALGVAPIAGSGGDVGQTVGALVVALFLGTLGFLQLMCGRGLWSLKPYGRTIQVVFAWIGLLGIPIGTIISILILVYLYKPGIKALFSGKPASEFTPEELTEISAVTQGSSGIVIAAVVIGVVVVFGSLVAAIAIPGLLRARQAGNEVSAIASLRAINSAQAAYSASCGSGFYAPTLTDLVKPPAGGTGFISPDLGSAPTVVKSGYTITMATSGRGSPDAPASCNGLPAGAGVRGYNATATPSPGSGARSFGTNVTGTIYEARQSTALGMTDDTAPASAKPVF